MDINENEEQIEEEMDQLLPDSADLAAPDVDEPVEVEQAEQAELAMEESAAVEADEPVETELGEPVAIETEELGDAEAEVEEVIDAEAEIDETEMDEPVDSQEDKFAIYKQEEAIQDEPEISAKYSVLAEPVKDDGRAWYVVHCYSGNEDKVRHNIMQRIESMGMDDLIFDVVVPTEDEVNIKNGERQTVEKKVFPGYILVNMALTEESWYMVRNTPGVTGFVGMGNDPTALQPEEVARILKRMESESPRVNVTFRQGERVRIVDGPFEDFYGKVAEIDMDRATVRVMVNFFGRETPVELDFLQVEEA